MATCRTLAAPAAAARARRLHGLGFATTAGQSAPLAAMSPDQRREKQTSSDAVSCPSDNRSAPPRGHVRTSASGSGEHKAGRVQTAKPEQTPELPQQMLCSHHGPLRV